jgi:serine/threonine protein kinase
VANLHDIETEDPFDLCGVTIEDKYRVVSVVGAGGFGVVYRGVHAGFGEPIAVKCLKIPAELSKRDREDLLAKLQDEGRVLHRLSKLSSSIVQALDVGAMIAPNGKWIPYLILEWLEGETLASHIASRRASGRGTFSLAEALELIEPAARALEVAHRQKVAHRDVKPENLYLAEVAGVRTLKVLDFGIAKVLTTATAFTAAPAATQKQGTAFTPSYGAPEQFNKKRGATGPWTDVFALALIIVELVSGERALSGDDATQLYIASADPASRPTLRYQGVETSDAIEDVLCRALAVDPNDRYQDAGVFWDALRAAARKPLRRDPAQLDVSATGEFVSKHDIDVDPDDLSAAPPPGGGAPAKARVASPTRREGSERPREEEAPASDPALEDERTTRKRPSAQPSPAHAAQPRRNEPAPVRRAVRADPKAKEAKDKEPALTQTPPAASGRWMPIVVLLALASGRGTVPLPSGNNPPPTKSGAADAGTPVPELPDAGPDAAAADGGGGAPAYTPPPGMVFVSAGGPVVDAFFIDAAEVTTDSYKQCTACGAPDGIVLTPEGAKALGIEEFDERYEKDWTPRCNGNRPDAGGDPVNCVNKRDAATFCSSRGAGIRLPKEAEWMRATTGGTERKFPWGDEAPSCAGVCFDLGGSCLGQAPQVGTCAISSHAGDRTPNGIVGLAGNVSEWTDGRVMGGNFSSKAEDLMRGTGVPSKTAVAMIGFRCALTAPAGYAPPQ